MIKDKVQSSQGICNWENTKVEYDDTTTIAEMLDKYYSLHRETTMVKNNVQRFLDTHKIVYMKELQQKYKAQGVPGLHDVYGCGESVVNIFLYILTQYENPNYVWY